MFCRERFSNWEQEATGIRRIRCGRIVMESGRLVSVESHWVSSPVSVAQIWWESRQGRLRGDRCLLDFHLPRGLESYLTLDYVRSGSQTSYKTFVGACHVLDEIARIRGVDAIVAHVTNVRISDRFLKRLGWQRHQHHWRGRHYIRRFYGEYPQLDLGRYA